MVVAGMEGVNLQGHDRSTIGAETVAAWLRDRSARLPWRVRAGFLCLPPCCLLCGGDGDLGAVDLCTECLVTLPFEVGRGIEHGPDPGLRTVFAPFTYDDPVGSGLRALKFDGDLRPARLFGALLAASAALAGRIPAGDIWAGDIPAGRRPVTVRPALVPVPLHPQRLAERGFNQAELIARQAACWLRLEVHRDALRRMRPTAPHTGLRGAERRRNLVDAFTATGEASGSWRSRRSRSSRSSRWSPTPVLPPLSPAQTRAILVDDVWTTGATLAAARAALRAGGIEVVDVWVVATARRARQDARIA